MTSPSIIVFSAAMILFMGLEVYVNVHDKGRRDASRDGNTLKTIARLRSAAFLIGITSAFFPIISLPGSRDIHFFIGGALVFSCFIIRGWAVFKLDKSFTSLVMTHENQRIIKDGPYRYIRHPAYLGVLLFYLGFGVAVGSLVGLVIIMFLAFYGFNKRIKVEEQVMISSFGDVYINYMKKTRKLIPLIF